MKWLVTWIKTHKLLCFLLAVILFLLLKNSSFETYSKAVSRSYPIANMSAPRPAGVDMVPESAPVANVKDRLVIKDSYLSLQVSNVVDTQKKVIKKAEELGGYMVSSTITNPSDAATATVIVRIPAKKLDSALEYYRSTGIKVVSENLQGDDVTDQYVDLETQLKTYEKTKAKFEEIFDRATLTQDILQIQREIINVQASIDSIKGQQDYLKKSAEMVKITVYLATDELALPYAPSQGWRPDVIFKQAARSVVGVIMMIGTLVIWIAVFGVIWVPALLIFFLVKRIRNRK